ncbi:hypothetical protein OG439_38505 [Amycolatopsis sp. NBC_01307]|uniref:hypothetical protein n=1 Tax=Amycolatopsis sp. NBC_01307 TaxID=2903561 RepID=UPI002E134D7E|nr:hypothetical protein OG439_38505 [Amycolatopsis sp. NBC_01307]
MTSTLPTTLAKVNGHRVEFAPAHREGNQSCVVTTITMGVPLSFEDITAVLMYVTDGSSREDLIDWLADPALVRRTVIESAWAMGGFAIEQERLKLAGIESGTWDSERLDLAWTCSVRVFATDTDVPAPRLSPEIA